MTYWVETGDDYPKGSCRHAITGCAVCAGIVDRYEPPAPTEGTRRVTISHESEALRISGKPAHTRPPAYVHNGQPTSAQGHMTLLRLNNAPSYAERKAKRTAPKAKPQPQESVTVGWQPMVEANKELAKSLGVTL